MKMSILCLSDKHIKHTNSESSRETKIKPNLNHTKLSLHNDLLLNPPQLVFSVACCYLLTNYYMAMTLAGSCHHLLGQYNSILLTHPGTELSHTLSLISELSLCVYQSLFNLLQLL